MGAQVKPKELEALGVELGIGKKGNELCKDEKIMKALHEQFVKAAKAGGLPPLMHIAAVLPVIEPWSAENGCLTATAKLVSKGVYKLHEEDLQWLKKKGIRG